MPKGNKIETYTILAAGATKTFVVSDSIDIYQIDANGGAVTLLADMIFSYSGTPKKGTQFNFIYTGGVTQNSGSGITVSFFGTNLTDAQALQELYVKAHWNGTTWNVLVFIDGNGAAVINGSSLVDGTVSTAKIADNAVTMAKIEDLTRGSIITGGAANVPTIKNFKDSGNILIGDGTDANSVAVTGDVTISSAGVTTIGASKVTPAMLSFALTSPLEASVTIATASVLTLNATPITIIAAPGATKMIVPMRVINAVQTYGGAAYATNTSLRHYIDTSNDIFVMNDIWSNIACACASVIQFWSSVTVPVIGW